MLNKDFIQKSNETRRSTRSRAPTARTNYIQLGGNPTQLPTLSFMAMAAVACKTCKQSYQEKEDGTKYCLCTYKKTLDKQNINYDNNTQITVESALEETHSEREDHNNNFRNQTDGNNSISLPPFVEDEPDLPNSIEFTSENQSVTGNDPRDMMSNTLRNLEGFSQDNRGYRDSTITLPSPLRNPPQAVSDHNQSSKVNFSGSGYAKSKRDENEINDKREGMLKNIMRSVAEQQAIHSEHLQKNREFMENQDRRLSLLQEMVEQRDNDQDFYRKNINYPHYSKPSLTQNPNHRINQNETKNITRRSYSPSTTTVGEVDHDLRNDGLVGLLHSSNDEVDDEDAGTGKAHNFKQVYKNKLKVSKPAKFRGDGEMLPEFEKNFHHYIEWEGVAETDAVILIRFLLEEEAKDFYDAMSQEDKMDVKTIFLKLRERFCPRSFKLIVHEKLCSDKQRDNETIDEFISRFNRMTQVIDLSEDQKIAQFITNLTNTLREHVIVSNPKTLAQAYEMARVKFAAQRHNNGSLEEQMKKMIQLQEKYLKKDTDGKFEKESTVAFLKSEIEELKRSIPSQINQILDQPNDSLTRYEIPKGGYGLSSRPEHPQSQKDHDNLYYYRRNYRESTKNHGN